MEIIVVVGIFKFTYIDLDFLRANDLVRAEFVRCIKDQGANCQLKGAEWGCSCPNQHL